MLNFKGMRFPDRSHLGQYSMVCDLPAELPANRGNDGGAWCVGRPFIDQSMSSPFAAIHRKMALNYTSVSAVAANPKPPARRRTKSRSATRENSAATSQGIWPWGSSYWTHRSSGHVLPERGKSLCRAGDIDRPAPISSVDQTVIRSHTRRLAGRPGPYHDPLGSHLSRTIDQESLSYWWRFTCGYQRRFIL